MPPRLNLSRRNVVLGEREWPFTVDFRTGSVQVELRGTAYRLRPLRWQEKRAFSRLGSPEEHILKRELVQTILLEPALPPVDPDEVEILFELGLWLADPQGSVTVPFNSSVLAAATVDLCRFTGMPSASFDSMDAAEVELMWQAAQKNLGGAEETGTPQATRIMIVPDAAPAPAFSSDPAAPSYGESTPAGKAAQRLRPDLSAAADAEREPVLEAAGQTADSSAPAAKAEASAQSKTSLPLRAAAPASAERVIASAGARLAGTAGGHKFRVIAWQSDQSATQFAARAGQERQIRRETRPDFSRADAAARRTTDTAIAGAAAGVATAASLAPRMPEAEPAIWTPMLAPVLRSPDGAVFRARLPQNEAAKFELARNAESAVAADPELLLDEFAEQLAQAAAQLGIDVES